MGKVNTAHHHNDLYRRQEVCEAKHEEIDTKFTFIQREIQRQCEELDRINNRIIASLIFAISTLATVLAILVKILAGG